MLGALDKLHMMHRCWRYRFKSEVPSLRLVRKAALRGCTLLDIGANRGIYSIYMSRAAGPDGRVIAFEAQPELGDYLESVKRSFGLDNLTIANIGLSSEAGTRTLSRKAVCSGGASLESGLPDGLESIPVTVARLDDYLTENHIGPIHFIKCDVEGHEWDVFKGAETTLRRDLPILLFECGHSKAETGKLFGYLCELGYDGYFFHVSRSNHRSYLHNGRGRYVHFSNFSEYEYVRPGLLLRNYVFLERGTRPESL